MIIYIIYKIYIIFGIYKIGLSNDGLSVEGIVQEFMKRQDDLEASKAFLDSNIDLISSKLFLRVLTAEKLSGWFIHILCR